MKTKIVEVGQDLASGHGNWGKMLIGVFDDEWTRKCVALELSGDDDPLIHRSLLHYIGYSQDLFMLFDLQTREGAMFKHGGYARADLQKHKIWVCPMFEPFLVWLYAQPLATVLALEVPDTVDLNDADFEFRGYRRPGKVESA